MFSEREKEAELDEVSLSSLSTRARREVFACWVVRRWFWIARLCL